MADGAPLPLTALLCSLLSAQPLLLSAAFDFSPLCFIFFSFLLFSERQIVRQATGSQHQQPPFPSLSFL